MATIVDVANRAGVSTATVSRVINSPQQVNETMREAVNQAIFDLGYRPNKAARALKMQESQTVGVMLNRFSAPYFGHLLEGIEETLFGLNFKTIAESGRESEDGQIAAWMSLVERQCESFIVHADAISEEHLRELLSRYKTSVLINRECAGFEDRCIVLDNYAAGQRAARYLLEKGHRQFATLTGPMDRNEAVSRHSGFLDELRKAGVEIAPNLVAHGWFSDIEAQDVVSQFLAQRDPFTAIFAQNDIMAAGAIEACQKAGVRVPNDVSVLGFDDLFLAQYLTPKLTTIRQPVRRIGAAAGQLAYQLVRPNAQGTGDIPRKFQAEVIERASVVAPPA